MVVKTEEVTTVSLQDETKSGHSLVPSQVEMGISTLLQLRERRKDAEGKKSLFHDEAQPIMLQFTPIRIPKTPFQQLRIPLPHSVYGKNPDICLITRDLRKGEKGHVEETVNYFQTRLDKNGVTGISQIIPYRQLIDEHKPYELKSRFASLYDVYLVEGQAYGPATRILGTRFFKRGKHLLPVSLKGDCKRWIEEALAKTVMTIHGGGDSYIVKVADTSFTTAEILENVFALVSALCRNNLFPGGFDNVRSIYVKTPLSLAIPIYLTLKSANLVPVPTVAPRLPRAYKALTGELSTFVGGEVTVYPDGEVALRKVFSREDREMGYHGGEDESDSGEELEDPAPGDEEGDDGVDMDVSVGQSDDGHSDAEDSPEAKKKRKDSDGDSSDEEVEAAEDAYLSKWQKDFEEKIEKEVAAEEEFPKVKPGKQAAKIGRKPEKLTTSVQSNLQAVPTTVENVEGGDTNKVKKQKKKKKLSPADDVLTQTIQPTASVLSNLQAVPTAVEIVKGSDANKVKKQKKKTLSPADDVLTQIAQPTASIQSNLQAVPTALEIVEGSDAKKGKKQKKKKTLSPADDVLTQTVQPTASVQSNLQAVPTIVEIVEGSDAKVKKQKKKDKKLPAPDVLVQTVEVEDVMQKKTNEKQEKLDGKKKKLEAFFGIGDGGSVEKVKAFKTFVTDGGRMKKKGQIAVASRAKRLAGISKSEPDVSLGNITGEKRENTLETKGNLPAFAGIAFDPAESDKTGGGKKKKNKENVPSPATGTANGSYTEVGVHKKLISKADKSKLSLIDHLLIAAKKAIATPDEKESHKMVAVKKESAPVKVVQSKKRKSEDLRLQSSVEEITKKNLLKIQAEPKKKKLQASVVDDKPEKTKVKAEKKTDAAVPAPGNDSSTSSVFAELSKSQKKKERKLLAALAAAGSNFASTLPTAAPAEVATVTKKVKPEWYAEALKGLNQKIAANSPAKPSPLKAGGAGRYFNTKLADVENSMSPPGKVGGIAKLEVIEKKKQKAKAAAARVITSGADMILKVNSNGEEKLKKDKKTKKVPAV